MEIINHPAESEDDLPGIAVSYNKVYYTWHNYYTSVY